MENEGGMPGGPGHGRGHGRGRGWGHGRGGGRGHGAGWGRGEGQGRGRGGRGAGWGAPLEPAILAALAAQPGHGYDLRAAVEEMTGSRLSVDPGGLYRLLRRLEEDGLVTSVWAEGTHGPQRRQYQVTAEGWQMLLDWREHLNERAATLQAIVTAMDAALETIPQAGDGRQADPAPRNEKNEKK